MAKVEKISVGKLIFDRDCYPREPGHTEWQDVERYKDAIEAGATLPPIVAVSAKACKKYPNGGYVVIDGWHRGQAHIRLKRDLIEAEILRIPESKWLIEAVRRNAGHGRPLTSADRAMVTYRLKLIGMSIVEISKITSTTVDALKKMESRVVENGNGNPHVLKAALASQAGTRYQKDAIKHGRAVANANVRRILDEFLATLRAHAIDPAIEDHRSRLVEIKKLVDELFAKSNVA